MKLSAIADVGVIAIGTEQSISVMLDITAPEVQSESPRAAQAVQVVLDRSGSMDGERLAAAKHAIAALVSRLSSEDSFGLVVFDNEAQVAVPNRVMGDHDTSEVLGIVSRISSGGSTDMSAGYTLGLSEVKRHLPVGGGSVIMLSDGHANAGVQDPQSFARLASHAADGNVTTSAVGIGRGYNEFLLEAMASGGRGNHVFAEQDDSAIALLLDQVDGLLSKSAMNAHLRFRPHVGGPAADFVRLLQRLDCWTEGEDLVARIGDLVSGENRRCVLDITVPARSVAGELPLVDVVLEYLAVPSLEQHIVTTTLSVTVSPDATDVIVSNPQVRVERLLAVLQDSKRSAVDAMAMGDDDAALKRVADARQSVQAALAASESALDEVTRSRAHDEISDLTQIEERIKRADRESSMKFAMENWSQKSRGRKRRAFEVEDDDTAGS